jgi:PAS domain S-box-containing protein
MTDDVKRPATEEALARAEHELAAARRRLESALIAGEVGTFEWDVVEDRLYGDANFERLFGIPLDATGAPLARFIEAIHPEDRARTMERIQHTMATGEPCEVDYRIVSGACTRWVVSRGKVERDASGRAVRFPGVLLDVSERVRAEAARREVERRFERQSRVLATMISSIEDFVYTFDRAGRFLFVNKPLLDLWGMRLEDAVGKDFFELPYPPELAAKLHAQIRQVVRTGQGVSDETEYTSPTGATGYYEYIFVPVFGVDGAVEVVAGSTRDITARKRMERALVDADRRKTEFLALLAHELRNPLAPIHNAVQILRMHGDDVQEVQRAAAMMQRQVGHMVTLVDDLLDVSRISRGKIEIRPQRIELAPIVQHAVEAARPLYDRRRHELTVELPDEPVWVRADATRMAQIVGNLLSNAAKFTDAGGHVTLTLERVDGQAVVRVRDDGIGIEAESLSRVFDMFVQVDTSLERSQGGLGLGLTLVKSLVELHGGSVEARSDGPGRGSEFAVRLPALRAAPAHEVPRLPIEPAPRRLAGGCRILVVDDNRDSADSLGMLLALNGNQVHTGYDGLEGVAAAERFRPEIVLLDIGMPKLSGYDACRRIREQPWGKDMVLIALTGWGQEEDKRRTEKAGFDAHLVKPVDPAALTELLASVTRSGGERAG